MKRTIVETIERELNRRNFLKRAALVTGAFITGLLVAPELASAGIPNGCCRLCFPNVGGCTWPADCACTWCWVCEEKINCFKWKALAGSHCVDAKRLRGGGVGMMAPAASNDSEEGRAKNRRVEIVKLN